MALGSIAGAAIDWSLLGVIPSSILLPGLAAILLISSVKEWTHKLSEESFQRRLESTSKKRTLPWDPDSFSTRPKQWRPTKTSSSSPCEAIAQATLSSKEGSIITNIGLELGDSLHHGATRFAQAQQRLVVVRDRLRVVVQVLLKRTTVVRKFILHGFQ